MGPLLLVDKSFIRALNPREAAVLQRHYCVVLCPVLLEELISDLAKDSLPATERIQAVMRLVAKSHGLSTLTITDARVIVGACLHGCDIRLGPQIPKFGGQEIVAADGSTGQLIDQSFEDNLLLDWAAGHFTAADNRIAGRLKRDGAALDLQEHQKRLQTAVPECKRFKTLLEIATEFNDVENAQLLHFGLVERLGRWAEVPVQELRKLEQSWARVGIDAFQRHAGYLYHCDKVLWLYSIGIAAELISVSKHQKTFIDICYFFFCHLSTRSSQATSFTAIFSSWSRETIKALCGVQN